MPIPPGWKKKPPERPILTNVSAGGEMMAKRKAMFDQLLKDAADG